jgi:hypothetical protein
MLRAVVSGVVLCAAASGVLIAQDARQRRQRVDPMTARVTGVVTTADTGAPVAGAEVRLSASSSYRRLVTTDGDGRFELSNLPSGEYRLTVTRAGYTPLEFGQRRPFEAPATIDLSEGESFTANVAVPRGGVIHGRVVDELGEPVAGTRVQALRARMVQGQRRLQSVGAGDQTDDTGAFRVYGLPPGDYYVAASAGEVNAVKRDPPLFYPGTPSFAEAHPITLAAGAEATADFQLAPIRTASVSGVALNSTGAPIAAMISLVSDVVGLGLSLEGNPPSALRLPADSGPDGRFTIENVPPGPYTLTAQAPFPDSFTAGFVAGATAAGGRTAAAAMMNDMIKRMPESASMPIVVTGDDISGLTLVTRTAGTLTVSIETDTGVTRPLPTGLRVTAASTHAGSMSMFAGGRDRFQLAGMTGPFRLETQGIPDGWAISAITMDGRDVTDEAIDLQGQNASARIVLTDRIASVGGAVQSRENVARQSVIVFADDESRWTYPSRYVRVTRTDEQGRFEVRGLPPNERYLALAVDYLEDGEEQDPQTLERLRSRATSFSLGEGERRSVWLDLVQR